MSLLLFLAARSNRKYSELKTELDKINLTIFGCDEKGIKGTTLLQEQACKLLNRRKEIMEILK